jgi:hypothetical protein
MSTPNFKYILLGVSKYCYGLTCNSLYKAEKPKKNQTGGHSRVRVYSDFQFSIEKVNALCLNFDVSKAILCSLMFT